MPYDGNSSEKYNWVVSTNISQRFYVENSDLWGVQRPAT